MLKLFFFVYVTVPRNAFNESLDQFHVGNSLLNCMPKTQMFCWVEQRNLQLLSNSISIHMSDVLLNCYINKRTIRPFIAYLRVQSSQAYWAVKSNGQGKFCRRSCKHYFCNLDFISCKPLIGYYFDVTTVVFTWFSRNRPFDRVLSQRDLDSNLSEKSFRQTLWQALKRMGLTRGFFKVHRQSS